MNVLVSMSSKGLYTATYWRADCLRDIKQYLLRDDRTESKPLLRRIGDMHIITLDLLPILLNTYAGQTEDQDLICGACCK
jgi:hypothetical protein